MAALFRQVLFSALLCSALASCGENAAPPGSPTAGPGGAGSGGTTPDDGGGRGGAGGAGVDEDGGRDNTGGAGNSGGGSPTDGGGGCAGYLSFVDPNVERAVVQFFDAGPVLAEHARHVDVLRINFTPTGPLTSLKGLECFTGMRRLDITGPDLPSWGLLDLSPLAAMTSLEWLDLYFDPPFGRDFGPWPHVLDLSPIAKLDTLQTLRLDINAVQDITALASLNFSSLFLYSETLSDLSPLTKITGLQTAFVRGKSITDVGPLAAALTAAGGRVLIMNTSISDISSFAALTRVRSLGLSNNLIREIAPIVSLPALTSLDVSNNPLDCATQMVHVQALQARGVRVTHSCP